MPTHTITGNGEIVNIDPGLIVQVDDAVAYDQSANANHGALNDYVDDSAARSVDVPANIGSGTSILTGLAPGQLQSIRVPDADPLDFAAGESWAVALWMKPNVNQPQTQYYLAKGRTDGGTNSNYSLTTINNRSRCRYITGSNNDFQMTPNILFNTWNHIVYQGTFTTPASWSAYHQGVNVGGSWVNGDGTAAPTAFTDELWFGRAQDTGLGVFQNGLLDDIRIYDRLLTDLEVTWIHTNGVSGTDPTTANLQGHWDMDGNAVQPEAHTVEALANPNDGDTFYVRSTTKGNLPVIIDGNGKNIHNPILGTVTATTAFFMIGSTIGFDFNAGLDVWQARTDYTPITGWLSNADGDLVPGLNVGIGSVDASPIFVAVGKVETEGTEGVMVRRPETSGGGVSLIGFRNQDPDVDPTPNAPVGLSGTALIFDGDIGSVVAQAVTEDHYLIVKPSEVLPDGRLIVPWAIGPRVVYTLQESNSDTSQIILVETVEDTIVELTTVGDFPAGAQITINCRVQENQSRSALITMLVYRNAVEIFQDSFTLNGNTLDYNQTFISAATNPPGTLLSYRVDYINDGTGAARDVQIRGDQVASEIEIVATN